MTHQSCHSWKLLKLKLCHVIYFIRNKNQYGGGVVVQLGAELRFFLGCKNINRSWWGPHPHATAWLLYGSKTTVLNRKNRHKEMMCGDLAGLRTLIKINVITLINKTNIKIYMIKVLCCFRIDLHPTLSSTPTDSASQSEWNYLNI